MIFNNFQIYAINLLNEYAYAVLDRRSTQMEKGNKQCLYDTPTNEWSIKKMMSENKSNENIKIILINSHLIEDRKMSKFTKLPYCQKFTLQAQTSSCKCSMCL